jgi:hypothetical protein
LFEIFVDDFKKALLLAKVAEETSNVDTTDENTEESQQLPPKRKRKQPDHLYDSEDGDGKSLTSVERCHKNGNRATNERMYM